MPHTTYTTTSEEETQSVAADFVRSLKGGDIVFLHGDLGSGKTTFVRGAARALGFDDPVRSPTFTIINRYPVDRGEIKQILHVDLYRIDDSSDLVPLALEEELVAPDTVAFIEWPENAKGLLAEPSHELFFSLDDGNRTINFLPPHASPPPRS